MRLWIRVLPQGFNESRSALESNLRVGGGVGSFFASSSSGV